MALVFGYWCSGVAVPWTISIGSGTASRAESGQNWTRAEGVPGHTVAPHPLAAPPSARAMDAPPAVRNPLSPHGVFRRGRGTPFPRPKGPSREKTKFPIGKILSGHFWYTNFWPPSPLPPPRSKDALLPPPPQKARRTVMWCASLVGKNRAKTKTPANCSLKTQFQGQPSIRC